MIPNTDILKRVYANLDIHPETMCWRYTGGTNGKDYGRIYHKGKMCGVHRLIFEVFHGPIPKRKEIHHLCFGRSCCNPAHLKLVSHRENVARIGRYEKLRWERLQDLVAANLDLMLCGMTRVTARDLQNIWGRSCRGSNIPRYLETLAFVFNGDFEWRWVKKGRGRKPSVFEIRISPNLIEQLESSENDASHPRMRSGTNFLALPVEVS